MDQLPTKSKLDMSYDNYQSIIQKNLSHKFSYLEEWLYKKSDKLLYEVDNFSRYKHPFKRGEIVRVDFGVNLGGEFSQIHLAIVISKQDTKFDDLIAVIPLTSKEHEKKTVSLGELVIGNLIANIHKELSETEKELKKIKSKTIRADELIKRIFANKNSNVPKDNSDEIAECSLIISENQKRLSELTNKGEKLEQIVKFYDTYKTVSHACYSQIKVISKSRISKPINEYDITNGTICSKEIMDIIDREVIRFYSGIDILKFDIVKDDMYSLE